MPQLNPEFFISQLFWLAVTFSFLLLFLWKISLPRINSVFEKREGKINNDIETAKQLQIVKNLNENLVAINESLGLDDAGLVEQLAAIRKKNTELALANEQLGSSKQQISEQLKILEELNIKLTSNEEKLQNQIKRYQM